MGMDERDRRPALRRVISKVEVSADQIRITIDPPALNDKATDSDSEGGESMAKGFTTFALPFKIVPRGGGARIMLAAGRSPSSDASTTAFVKALVRGYRWRQQLMNGEARSMAAIAQSKAVTVRYVSRLVRLSLLAPDIVERILDRRLPASVTLNSVLYSLPYDWNEQRRLFGLRTADIR
jgi:hypothetical protein